MQQTKNDKIFANVIPVRTQLKITILLIQKSNTINKDDDVILRKWY